MNRLGDVKGTVLEKMKKVSALYNVNRKGETLIRESLIST